MTLYGGHSKEVQPGTYAVGTLKRSEEGCESQVIFVAENDSLADAFIALGIVTYLENRNKETIIIEEEED